MARARNIKPGFFKNEHLAELSPEARLLFIGLWTMADREGRLEDRPKRIKMEIMPCDAKEVNDLLNELEQSEGEFIKRYEVEGKKYIQIVNFLKHQKPHMKESASVFPAMPEKNNDEPQPRLVPAPTQVIASPSDSLLSDSLLSDSPTPTNSANTVPSGGGHFFEIEMHGQRLTEGEWIYRNMMEHRRNKGWASKGAEDLQSLLTLYPNHMEQWRKWATLPIAKRIAAFAFAAIETTPDNHFKLALKLGVDGEGDDFMRYLARAQSQVDKKDYFVRIS